MKSNSTAATKEEEDENRETSSVPFIETWVFENTSQVILDFFIRNGRILREQHRPGPGQGLVYSSRKQIKEYVLRFLSYHLPIHCTLAMMERVRREFHQTLDNMMKEGGSLQQLLGLDAAGCCDARGVNIIKSRFSHTFKVCLLLFLLCHTTLPMPF